MISRNGIMTDNLFNTKERDLLSMHEIMKYET